MTKHFSLIVGAAILLYSATVSARICFLADTDCQEGDYGLNEDTIYRCEESPESGDWVLETKLCLEAKSYELVCVDDKNYYQETGCINGYCSKEEIEKTGNKLENYFTKQTACENCYKYLFCKSTFKNCVADGYSYIGDVTGSGETCQNIGENCVVTGEKLYEKCNCNASKYQYKKTTCSGRGLSFNTECKGDNGEFGTCACADGYQSNNTCDYGVEDSVTTTSISGSKLTCYKCRSKPDCVGYDGWQKNTSAGTVCPSGVASYEAYGTGYCVKCNACSGKTSNFDAFWKGYYVAPATVYPVQTCVNSTGKLTVDCAVLGYDSGTAATGRKCKDGTEPYRCPFNHEAVYCASGL